MPRFTLYIDPDKALGDHPMTWQEMINEARYALDKIEDLQGLSGVLDKPVDRLVTFPINEWSAGFANKVGQYKVAARPDERT